MYNITYNIKPQYIVKTIFVHTKYSGIVLTKYTMCCYNIKAK